MPVAARRVLVYATVLGALLRLPALLPGWGVISDDEAIYDAMARTLTSDVPTAPPTSATGATTPGVMYRDTVDHKPPGLAYTYAACRRLATALHGRPDGAGALSMALVHLLGLVFVVGTSLGLYAVGGRIYALAPTYAADAPLLGAWAALLYALVSAAKQPVDGLAVNGELLMNLPLVWAAWAAVSATGAAGRVRLRARLLDMLAGAFVGVAVLYKYQAGLLGAVLPLLVLVDGSTLGARLRALVERGTAWALGFASVLAAVALYFHARGVFDEALFWGIDFNRHYLQEGPGLAWALQRLGLQLVAVVLPGVAVYAGATWQAARLLRLQQSGGAFLLGWALVSLASVGLGGRFFGHYFLQAEPPLCLLAAVPVAALAGRSDGAGRANGRRAILLVVPALPFYVLSLFPHAAHRLLSPDDPDYVAIGREVAASTAPDDTVWVWGNVPQIYFHADRAPGVRFTFCNYLTGLSPATPSEYREGEDPSAHAVPGAAERARADLERRRPRVVVDTAAHDLKHYGRFPLFRVPLVGAYVAAHYRLVSGASLAPLYVRVE